MIKSEKFERIYNPCYPLPVTSGYEYAKEIAIHLWEEFYKKESPEWQPLDDLMGVLTQIDNMTVGLKRGGER